MKKSTQSSVAIIEFSLILFRTEQIKGRRSAHAVKPKDISNLIYRLF